MNWKHIPFRVRSCLPLPIVHRIPPSYQTGEEHVLQSERTCQRGGKGMERKHSPLRALLVWSLPTVYHIPLDYWHSGYGTILDKTEVSRQRSNEKIREETYRQKPQTLSPGVLIFIARAFWMIVESPHCPQRQEVCNDR